MAGDGLDMLEEMLKANAPAPVAAAAPPAGPDAQAPVAAAAAPAAAPTAPAGMSRLEMLKQMAQAKAAAPAAEDPSKNLGRRVGDALARAAAYLEELNKQLDIVKPPFAGRGYQIPGVPEFAGLAWSDGNINVRNKTNATIEQVGLYYTFSGGKQLRIVREYPASDRLRQQLLECKIEFQYNDKKSEKGSLLNTTFGFLCEVKAQVVFHGQFDTGKLLLKMRNVERFGAVEYLVSPEAVTQEALEELAGHILGELPQVTLLRKNV